MAFIDTVVTICAIFFTVGALSLPLKDNLYWKICEHMYLGFAAGYMLIVGIKAIQSNLISPLLSGNLLSVVALILALLMYSRFLGKRYSWLSRYPIAILVAVGTAVSVRTLTDAMIVGQITDTFINPLAQASAQVGSVKTPLNNIIIILGTVTTLFYFIFVKTGYTESKSANTIRTLGIWFLMFSFGSNLGNGWLMRTARLGARFTEMLQPDFYLYTAIFALLAIASLYFTGKAESDIDFDAIPEVDEA